MITWAPSLIIMYSALPPLFFLYMGALQRHLGSSSFELNDVLLIVADGFAFLAVYNLLISGAGESFCTLILCYGQLHHLCAAKYFPHIRVL